jgi:hypothetical protein
MYDISKASPTRKTYNDDEYQVFSKIHMEV